MTNITFPKISTKIASYAVYVSDEKQVKAWIKDSKTKLKDYVELMLMKAERELQIGFMKIYELEATYFNSYEMPVITITAKAIDRMTTKPDGIIFVEVFANEDGTSTLNRYSK